LEIFNHSWDGFLLDCFDDLVKEYIPVFFQLYCFLEKIYFLSNNQNFDSLMFDKLFPEFLGVAVNVFGHEESNHDPNLVRY
jgi:hypothetical protein